MLYIVMPFIIIFNFFLTLFLFIRFQAVLFYFRECKVQLTFFLYPFHTLSQFFYFSMNRRKKKGNQPSDSSHFIPNLKKRKKKWDVRRKLILDLCLFFFQPKLIPCIAKHQKQFTFFLKKITQSAKPSQRLEARDFFREEMHM